MNMSIKQGDMYLDNIAFFYIYFLNYMKSFITTLQILIILFQLLFPYLEILNIPHIH
jgi:hypothetical protein